LTFNYGQTRVANTFDAHRLQHLATTQRKGDVMAEALFKAFFTDGRNIADLDTLAKLASSVGLPEARAREVLVSGAFADDVRRDIDEALQLGVTGVPFFVIDGRYAVSGAQDSSIFRQALQRALSDSTARKEELEEEGPAVITCRVDGDCQ
jgi:predicted DsbA family dithiol-disulfide isomerase